MSLVLYRDLARAIRRESVIAIRHWWGVGDGVVGRWRRALGVPQINEGTLARRVAYANSPRHRKASAAMQAMAQDPGRRAKIGAAKRGSAMPAHVIEALRKANKGRPLSREHRRKMSEAHKRRGTRPPWINKAWSAREDALALSLLPAEAAKRTGRTYYAVTSRRHELRLANH